MATEKKIEEATMLVAVKPEIEIPHVAMYKGVEYSFEPVCKVPVDFGQALVKNNGHVFYAPKSEAEIDKKLYTFSDKFRNKSVTEIVATLGDDQKLKVLHFAKALAKGEEIPLDPPFPKREAMTLEDVTAQLQELTVEKLEALAFLRDVEIPGSVKNKADIVAFLAKEFFEKQIAL